MDLWEERNHTDRPKPGPVPNAATNDDREKLCPPHEVGFCMRDEKFTGESIGACGLPELESRDGLFDLRTSDRCNLGRLDRGQTRQPIKHKVEVMLRVRQALRCKQSRKIVLDLLSPLCLGPGESESLFGAGHPPVGTSESFDCPRLIPESSTHDNSLLLSLADSPELHDLSLKVTKFGGG